MSKGQTVGRGKATGGGITVTLPEAAKRRNRGVYMKKIDSSGNAITIGATVDGSVNPTLGSQYDGVLIVSDGSAYYKLADV